MKLANIDPLKFKNCVLTRASWFVAVFYYILYFSSLFSEFNQFYQPKQINVGKVEQNSLIWVEYIIEPQAFQEYSNMFIIIMMLNHVSSFIFFTLAIVTKNKTSKEQYQKEFIYYLKDNCTFCNKPLQSRQSHCRQCQVCHLKKDHHCIWINGCVHQANVKYFTTFLISTAVASLFKSFVDYETISMSFLVAPIGFYNFKDCISMTQMGFFLKVHWILYNLPINSVSFLMHFMIGLMLLPFGLTHLYQIIKNETSLEKSKKQNIKDDILGGFAILAKNNLNGSIHLVNNENSVRFSKSKYTPLATEEAISYMKQYKPFK